MSHKLKTHESVKIQKPEAGCFSEQYPHISFRYLTQNSRYNFGFIEKLDSNEKATVSLLLLKRLEELSKVSWQELAANTKKHGLETLKRKQLHFRGTDDNTEDSKVFVLQFDTHLGSKQGRIIGFKDSPCSALYVTGFDFDFSAYDHS